MLKKILQAKISIVHLILVCFLFGGFTNMIISIFVGFLLGAIIGGGPVNAKTWWFVFYTIWFLLPIIFLNPFILYRIKTNCKTGDFSHAKNYLIATGVVLAVDIFSISSM